MHKIKKVHKHNARISTDIILLEEYRQPIPPIIAQQVGRNEHVFHPGPARLEINVSNNSNMKIFTVLCQDGNWTRSLPVHNLPDLKFEFVTE